MLAWSLSYSLYCYILLAFNENNASLLKNVLTSYSLYPETCPLGLGLCKRFGNLIRLVKIYKFHPDIRK